MRGQLAQPEAAAQPTADEEPTGRDRMDPVLREIFLKETRGHIETVHAFLVEAEAAVAPLRPSEDLYRACHTLLGSARMAGLAAGEALAAPMEQYVRGLMSAGAAVTPAGRAALAKGCAEIEHMMTEIAGERDVEVDEQGLLAAFAQPQAELDAVVAEAPEPDSGQWQTISEPAPDVAETEVEPAEAPAAARAAGEDFDPELAAIFSEEAGEILEQADDLLARWSPSHGPDVVELQRLLHTLKGGARMAGLTSMGDLSHEMESLLEGLAAGRVVPGPGLPQLLQRSVDTLHSMRDSLDAGHQLSVDHKLLEALSAAAAGRETEAEAAPDAEDLSAQPQAPEVFDTPEASPDTEAETAPPEVEVPADSAQEADEETFPLLLDAADDEPLDELPGELFAEAPDARQPGADGAARPREDEIADSITGLTALLDEIDAPVVPDADEVATADSELHDWQTDAAGPGDAADAPVVDEPAEPAAPVPQDAEVEQPDAPTSAPGDAELEDWLPEEAEASSPDAPEYFSDEDMQVDEAPASGDAADAPELEIAAQAQDAAAVPSAAPRMRAQATERQEFARIDAELLDDMLNSAGEISIFHSRLNRQVGSIEFHLGELSQTATRMREQLRALEAETERQILHRHHEDSTGSDDFDPLELDRYSTLQQLSRALAESVSDVSSINDLLRTLSTDADTLLVQQGRVTLQLQDSLMRTRMVPFQRHVTRLARLVRQTASETGKRAELVVKGATGELDRQVLEQMLPPLEHLLRNAVIHGIESPSERHAAHKAETGEISVHMRRDGSEVVIDVADDGAGINTQAIRAKAMEQGLLKPGERLSDEAAKEMILRPGFSTATQLTQSAGRGVGMDVVASQVQKLGGSLRIESKRGQGTRFIVRLPYTLAITQALIVKVGDETFALPLPTVEGIARISRDELLERLTEDEPRFEYAGHSFRLQHLGLFVGGSPSRLPEDDTAVPVILVRAAEHSTALITDELMGSREIVVKTLGPQITGIPGVSGATILGDGSIVVILDVGTLVRAQRDELLPQPMAPQVDTRLLALVVDDSITVRRVTQRLLERNGMRVMTAKDGMDAITALQDARPDIILLDIEMPRMDGYQFASHVRNDPRVADVPIIMITSRSSEKHRARAIEVGVNDYLSKPYQESQLLNAIAPLVRRDMS
ncbi:MAG: response regulator [Gammaproteobacteria bacterium]|nr:response regulator [Gammaproteobacteria bacterium]